MRPTHRYPTRSGLTGLIASALGRPLKLREHRPKPAHVHRPR
ncbi:CRISPR-associated protein Cas5 [Streptomyces decoyicus]